MANASYSKELGFAFAVSAEDVGKIARLLDDRVGNVKISAQCADDITREFSDAKDLGKYENAKSKRIKRLRVIARSDDFGKTAEVAFHGTLFRGIEIEVSAPGPVVTRLRDDVLDVVSGTRSWYAFVSRVNFFLVGLLMPAVLWLAMIAVVAVAEAPATQPSPPNEQFRLAARVVIAFIGVVGTGVCLEWMKHIEFPRSSFRIGQGLQRYKTLEAVRWTILFGFLVSLSASIVLSIWK